MSIFDWNKAAWDAAVEGGENPYTQVVSPEKIEAARQGTWSVFLTDLKPTPADWFPPLREAEVLCLASGGGQQAPVLAAAGANVTLIDASPAQLGQDRFVAQRDQLEIELIEGDIADLSMLSDGRFDLIFNPVSTIFVPDLEPVWRECFRVLKPGGSLLTGMMNPDEFVFDPDEIDEGRFVVRYRLPYIEHETLSEEAVQARIAQKGMFHFSHSMESQLGGMLQAGFIMIGFYEDRRPDEDGNPIRHYMPSYFAARMRKPAV